MTRQEQIQRMVDYLQTLPDTQVWSWQVIDHPVIWPDRATLHYQLHEERKRRGMAVTNFYGRTLFVKPNAHWGRCAHCGQEFTREQFQSHNHD